VFMLLLIVQSSKKQPQAKRSHMIIGFIKGCEMIQLLGVD
jgi:hypothetical protein